ncbi:MAG: hypothetical protein J5642_02915 [Bacteroidales bacterium]|nr:hypothetical protein [Bacteroidales bacterium]
MMNLRFFLFGFVLLFFVPVVQAQETEEDEIYNHQIDSAMALSPDYLPTSFTYCSTIFFQPVKYQEIDTTMSHVGMYDPLIQTSNIYQTLGIFGQAHKPMNFSFKKEPGFSLITNPYPLYFKNQSDLKYYKLKTVYTDIAYTLGISKENEIFATHAQNIRDKVNYAFNLRGLTNQGFFTHQKTSSVSFDGMMHYEIPSEIYGFRLSYILNHFNMQENGGLLNAQDFIDHIVKDGLSGYNMKMYEAVGKLLSHDLMFQQYVNLKGKKIRKEGKDNYWGTLTHTFQFRQQQYSFFDTPADTGFYYNHIFGADSIQDTLMFYTVSNTLQFSTFQPYREPRFERYFVHFTGGITHEFTDYRSNFYRKNAFIPFAQAQIRLFRKMDIHARIYYTLGGYQNNDMNFSAAVSWKLNNEGDHFFGADFDFYYLSPDYIFHTFVDNYHFWRLSFPKQNIVRFTPYWEYKGYRVEFSYFMLHNYVYLNELRTPALLDSYANILQLHVNVPFFYRGFGVNFNGYLQYSNKKEIQVPLFAGKLDFYYRRNIFKNKAQFQVGFNAAFNTSYYADAYYPLLHQFYHQHEVKTGNYFYWDVYVGLQVKRIRLFFKTMHVLSGALGYNYFTTPDYPMQSRRFILGISWRFHD